MRRRFEVRRPLLLGVLVGGIGVACVAIAAPAIAQTASQWIRGGGFAGKIVEPKFVYTHNEGEKLAAETNRDLFKVPDDYGEPFAVTVANNQQIVWYRSTALGVRNVIIESDRRLVHVLPWANQAKNPIEQAPTR